MNKLKIGVVIARFQPLLEGQIKKILNPAIIGSDLVVILLGSSGRARTCVDPLTNDDRIEMIKWSLGGFDNICFDHIENGKACIIFEPIRDFFYAETPVDWIVQVQSKVRNAINKGVPIAVQKNHKPEVTLYGASDYSNEKPYHNWFPQWGLYEVNFKDEDQSSKALEQLFTGATIKEFTETHFFLDKWLQTDSGQRLKEEYRYVKEYKKRTQIGNYPIQFNTTDNVCYYKGNVLLVKRRSQPGKGLWALPGGFLEVDETCKQGAVRELLEETKLRVRDEWLVSRDVFDHPRRSVRGRTITNAFLWKIPDSNKYPQVTAGSDASRVKWFPLSTILEEMQEQLFEDHLDIIGTLTKRL